ncbi:MAG: hypothetical protein WCT32_03245 [Patescibacteria group bacterium]|jgi:hypothetical protein
MNLYNLAHLGIKKGDIPRLVISDDGLVLVATAGKGFWVYNTKQKVRTSSGTFLRNFTAQAVSPDGKLAAYGNVKGDIYLHSLEEEPGEVNPVAIYSPHDKNVIMALAFSNNGLIASGSCQGIGIWDIHLPGLLKFIPISKENVVGLHFDSQKNLIAVTDAQTKRYRWGDFEEDYDGCTNGTSFAWSMSSIRPCGPYGKDLIAIGSQAEVRLHLVEEVAAERREGRFIGTYYGWITAMTLWDKILAAAIKEDNEDVFRLGLFEQLGNCERVANVMRFNRRITSLAASPDTLYIALDNGLIQGLTL